MGWLKAMPAERRVKGWVVLDSAEYGVKFGLTATWLSGVMDEHAVLVDPSKGFTQANFEQAARVLDSGEGWPV